MALIQAPKTDCKHKMHKLVNRNVVAGWFHVALDFTPTRTNKTGTEGHKHTASVNQKSRIGLHQIAISTPRIVGYKLNL